MKYIVVSGGVISGIGKGVIASSTGLLLKAYGMKVTSIKIDPYMNIDAGTMSPLEHGEVFVLDDGGEVDLDLGNYERYLNVRLTRDHNITTGKVYQAVINKERKGDYLGKTVQVVPHVTNEIQEWIERVSRIPVDDTNETPEVCIIELGGTVGDIESAPFVEALRQFQFRVGPENFALIHVSLVPVIHGEQKTKPTQAAIKELRSLGLSPDIIACRCSEELIQATTDKISMFCHVGPEQVLGVHDVSSTYHVPVLLEQQGLLKFFVERFWLSSGENTSGVINGGLPISPQRASKRSSFSEMRRPSSAMAVSLAASERGHRLWKKWKALTVSHDRSFETVNIALVGKYTHLQDSYISVVKSLEHSALRCQKRLNITWIEATNLEADACEANKVEYHKAWADVCSADGILVPGGFGSRGTEGMISAAKWARENKVPYLGVCLGFQVAAIEFARNVLNLANANSEELDKDTDHKVIMFMPEGSKTHMGGTMRLGIRPAYFNEHPSKLRKLYGNGDHINERHRHRYEVNPSYIDQFEKAGLNFVAKDEQNERMEIFELENHPFFVGTQYHPEYLSRVLDPSKPFLGLVAAACGSLDKIIAESATRDTGEAAVGEF